MKRTFYVVWQTTNGGYDSDTIEIEGKVNELSVKKAVRDSLSYYKRDEVARIISWQETEEFDFDEKRNFYANL